MKKISLKNLFDNKRFVLVFAVAAAVISWIAVAMTTEQPFERTIGNVHVNMDMQSEILAENGLVLIGESDSLVNVSVRGQRTLVSGLKSDDLVITARVSNITEPDTYDLTLISGQPNSDYGIVKIEPSTVRVRLDQIVSKEIPVTPVVKGVSSPPEYTQDIERVTPGTVKITGPESELQKIESCTVTVELYEPLTRNYAAEVPIEVLDMTGQKIELEESQLSLDYYTATVVVPVLRIKQLPLQISFTNKPMGFPEDELREHMILTSLSNSSLSNSSIKVAGPVSTMNNYNELRLGVIDLRTLSKENSIYNFDVTLPSDQFTNMDNVRTVKVEFDSQGWSSAVFNNIRDIAQFDQPLGYSVTLLTNSLGNVVFTGPEEIIETLTSDDIVAEVYYSDRELTPGQYRYPIHLSAPTKGMVWPVGEYTVIIQVVEVPTEGN